MWRVVMLLVLLAAVTPVPSSAQPDADVVATLLRDLQSRDFDRAHSAAAKLAKYPAHRARTVPVLIQALASREWDRCSADARDEIARTLATLKARDAVTPLVDLVKSGKPIEHECFE